LATNQNIFDNILLSGLEKPIIYHDSVKISTYLISYQPTNICLISCCIDVITISDVVLVDAEPLGHNRAHEI